MVRAWGFEPQRIAAQEPKSCMSASSIMPAYEHPGDIPAVIYLTKGKKNARNS